MSPVILVSLDWRRPQDGKTSLGIASIAAALQASHVPCRIINAQVNSPDFSLKQVLCELGQAIDEAGTDCLVGFGTYVWNDSEVQSLIQQIKDTDARIVLGGPQVSYVAKGYLEGTYPEADYFIRGQGEKGMVALAHGALQDDCGIHVAGNPDLGHTADQDLLTMPSPYLLGTIEPRASIRWETQRGCPFKCAFCQHREPGKRPVHKWFEENRLRQELELFASSGVRRISILDPIFHTNLSHAIKVLNSIKAAGITAQLSLQCRFETCNSEFLDALDGLDVTLEFGLQTTVEAEYRAINRPNHMLKVRDTIRELHKRKIDFEISLIYGLPNQTLNSFQTSVDWCLHQQVPRLLAWPLMLLRGTPLYDQKNRYGFKESLDQRIPVVIASHSFSELDHAKMTHIARALEEN